MKISEWNCELCNGKFITKNNQSPLDIDHYNCEVLPSLYIKCNGEEFRKINEVEIKSV